MTISLMVAGRYLLAILMVNLAWEFAQLPLYTIWRTGTPGQIAFAALHCTGGDVLIAASVFLGTVVVIGGRGWPCRRFGAVAATTVTASLLYTVFSEWLNTEIRGSWAYSSWMPKLPLVGTGLAPFAQWLVVPTLAFMWARRRIRPADVTSAQGAPK
jgi:hypothetical protein